MLSEFTSHDEEIALLQHLRSKDIHNDAGRVLEEIDVYTQTHHLANIGPAKGKLLSHIIERTKPETVLEMGTHTGYGAIVIAKQLEETSSSTAKVYTFEQDPVFNTISAAIIKMSGLSHRVVQIEGKASEFVEKVTEEHNIEKIDMLFIDHWKHYYLPDLRVVETLGLITEGSVIVADNVILPGAPDYLDYVQSPPCSKREFNYRVKNVNGKRYIGKWGLIYETDTIKGFGKDGMEVTKCVGILDS